MKLGAIAAMREQQQIAEWLDRERRDKGDMRAEILAGSLVIGVVNYLTKRYGSRHAYETIQQIADRIPEFPHEPA